MQTWRNNWSVRHLGSFHVDLYSLQRFFFLKRSTGSDPRLSAYVFRESHHCAPLGQPCAWYMERWKISSFVGGLGAVCGVRCAVCAAIIHSLRPSTFSTEAAVPRCTYGTWRTPQLQFQQTPFFPDFEGEGPQWRIWYWCRYWYWYKMCIFSSRLHMNSAIFPEWLRLGLVLSWTQTNLLDLEWTICHLSCKCFVHGFPEWLMMASNWSQASTCAGSRWRKRRRWEEFFSVFASIFCCFNLWQMTMDNWPWMIASPLFRCLRLGIEQFFDVRRLLKILQFQLCQSTSSALPRHLNGMEIIWVFPRMSMGLKVLGI